MDDKEKQIKDFLRDLNRLTRKHGIKIGSCGCCDSPFLSNGTKIIAEKLTWVEEDKPYYIVVTRSERS